ncbi:MAG: histidine kinase dimerization/phospho-acceptor domain-containing protein [Kiloniellales bacterium]
MWPYDDEDLERLERIAVQTGPGLDLGNSPESIEYYIRRGRHLRSLLVGIAIGRALASLRDWLVGANPAGQVTERLAELGTDPAAASTGDDFIGLVTDRLKTPLTSIRASSEILRDNPDLPLDKRNQFLDTVIQENAYLEGLIGRMLDVSRFEPGARRWQINAAELAGHLLARRHAQQSHG